jgi:hypothetical protein
MFRVPVFVYCDFQYNGAFNPATQRLSEVMNGRTRDTTWPGVAIFAASGPGRKLALSSHADEHL